MDNFSSKSFARGSHEDCHQPLKVRRLEAVECGLTVVTKWADFVVTLNSTRVLKEAGKVAFA